MSDQESSVGSASRSTRSSLTAIFSPMTEEPQLSTQPQSSPQPPQSPIIPATSPPADAPLWFYINGQGYPTQGPVEYLIGRGDACTIKVNDQQVSTRHCQVKNGTLIDCRSTNGTSVNGEILPPNQPHVLKAGDVIYIGSTEISIRPNIDAAAPSLSAPATQPSKPLDLSNLPQTTAEPASPMGSAQPNNVPFKPSGSIGNRYAVMGRSNGPSKTPFVGAPKGRQQFDPAAIAAFNQQEAAKSESTQPAQPTTQPTTQPPSASPSPVYPATPAVGIGLVHDAESQTTTSSSNDATTQPSPFMNSLNNLPTMGRLAGVTPAPATTQPTTTNSTVSGVPNTDEILNADPAAQRAHIEFLRGEIFRLRRDIMMDKKAGIVRKKPGVIGANTFGSDNSDIFKEVIDLKKQMQDLKFVYLYGDDQEVIDKAMSTEGLGEMKTILEVSGTAENGKDPKPDVDTIVAQKTQELNDRIRQLESQLGQKGLEMTNLQGTFDLELSQTEARYKDLLLSKDEQLKSLTEAFEREQKLMEAEWQRKLDSAMLLAAETNAQNSAQIAELTQFQDKCQALADSILVLEAEKANLLQIQAETPVGGGVEVELLKQQHEEELNQVRQQLRDSQAYYEKMIEEEVKAKMAELNQRFEAERAKNEEMLKLVEEMKLHNSTLVKDNADLVTKNSQLEKNNLQQMTTLNQNPLLPNNSSSSSPALITASTDQEVASMAKAAEVVEQLNQVQAQLQERDNAVKSKEIQMAQLVQDLDSFKSQINILETSKAQTDTQCRAQLDQLQQSNAQLTKQLALLQQAQTDTTTTTTTATAAAADSLASVEAKLNQQLDDNKRIQSLLAQTLQQVINQNQHISPKERDQILSDVAQMERFVKTDALKQSLQAGNALLQKTTTDNVVDPFQALKDLPPQIIAMIAVPAALLAALLVALVK